MTELETKATSLRYTKTLTLREDVDVLVVGGGAAGVAAALAASRQGKRVYLVEARGSFGGAVSAGLVPSLATFTDGVNLLAAGIGSEIRARVSKDIPIESKWTPLKVEEFKRALDGLMKESTVTYTFFTTLCDVVTDGKRIDYVVLSSVQGMFALRAKVYIDCTGDGLLCALGGARYEIGDEERTVMPVTLCSLWANIDFSKRDCSDDAHLEEAIADGVFSQADRHLPGMQRADVPNGIGGGNIGHIFKIDPEDPSALTRAMMQGREQLLEYERYYKGYLKGFDELTLVYSADMLGVRESRRIVCDYMLNAADFKGRAVFDDEIGRYSYPVDIHVMTTEKSEYDRFQREYTQEFRYKTGESYGIPYRSLIPCDFTNVLVAGRCIGTDRAMQASVRVVPGCFITGQAAGIAAALASDTGDVRAVSRAALQKGLLALGAYLPNAIKAE